jgi:hypothetical protein
MELPVVCCKYPPSPHYFLKDVQEDMDDMLRGPRDVKCCLGNFPCVGTDHTVLKQTTRPQLILINRKSL